MTEAPETSVGRTLAPAGRKLPPGSEDHTLGARFRRQGGIWLGLFAFVIFFHIAGFGFLAWDRELFSNQSPVIFGISGPAVSGAFSANAPWDAEYGPVAMLSHMVDFQLYRLVPFAHHLANVWIHVFNVVLVFGLAKELTRSARVANVAAALFALHPLQVGPVVWVCQRRILLATLFVLATMWLWLRYRRTGTRTDCLWALACCFLAVLSWLPSGAMVLLLPILERAHDQARAREFLKAPSTLTAAHPDGSAAPRLILFGLGAAAVVSGLLAGTISTVFCKTGPVPSLVEGIGLVTARLVGAAAVLGFVPLRLVGWSCPPTVASADADDVTRAVVVAAIGGFLLACAAWRWRRNFGGVVFAGTAWFIAFAVVASLCGVEGAFAPVQWTYLANVGLALAVGVFVASALQCVQRRLVATIALVAALMALAWAGTREMREWSDSDGIARRLLTSSGTRAQRWRAWHCLAVTQTDRGKWREAASSFHTALASRWDPRTLLFLGTLERRDGKPERARIIFKEVAALGESAGPAHASLGQMARERGELEEAARQFRMALESDPREIQALIGLAMIRAAAPDPALRNGPEALRLARRALALTKSGNLHAVSAAAAAHAELGEFQMAQVLSRLALFWTVHLQATNEIVWCEQRLESYKTNGLWRLPNLRTNAGAAVQSGGPAGAPVLTPSIR